MAAPKRIDRVEFARLYADGATPGTLAAHFGVDLSTVSRTRKALGLPAQAPRMTADRRAVIDALLDQGLSFGEIHRREGVDMGTLRRYWPGRDSFAPIPADRLARIADLLDDGASFEEVIRTEGVARQSLVRHFPGRAWTPEQRVEHNVALRLWRDVGARSATGTTEKYLGNFRP